MSEFWPELLTIASWEKLRELKKELGDFVLIGGWAVYLWTGMHKSKDIDIIVDFKGLERLRKIYDVGKNPNLKKYEVKLEKFDIDIYVAYFSEFIIPAQELLKKTFSVQGFRTPEPEALLILKQSAEISRRGSIKGEKDAIDILSLLRAKFRKSVYLGLLKKYKIEFYRSELLRVVKDFDPKDSAHLGMGFKEFQGWRKKILKDI